MKHLKSLVWVSYVCIFLGCLFLTFKRVGAASLGLELNQTTFSIPMEAKIKKDKRFVVAFEEADEETTVRIVKDVQTGKTFLYYQLYQSAAITPLQ